MAIFYEYTITVNGDTASLNRDIFIFKNNRNIDYYFIIKDATFCFDNLSSSENINAPYASIKLLDPNGKKLMTKKVNVIDGKVHLKITETLIDEDTEIGSYSFQIDLYDGENGRISIPPVINKLHVLAPLFDDDDAILLDEETKIE